MRIAVTCGAVLLVLGGCAKTLDEYQPVVDLAQSDPAAYQSDLAQCREIAKAAQEQFREEQQRQAMGRILVGAIAGAAIGAAAGSITGNSGRGAGVGAIYGTGAGAASAAGDDYQAIRGQPQRIIDRCLAYRGHTVLSDIGQGTGQY